MYCPRGPAIPFLIVRFGVAESPVVQNLLLSAENIVLPPPPPAGGRPPPPPPWSAAARAISSLTQKFM